MSVLKKDHGFSFIVEYIGRHSRLVDILLRYTPPALSDNSAFFSL